jgi:hypothetical protein
MLVAREGHASDGDTFPGHTVLLHLRNTSESLILESSNSTNGSWEQT